MNLHPLKSLHNLVKNDPEFNPESLELPVENFGQAILGISTTACDLFNCGLSPQQVMKAIGIVATELHVPEDERDTAKVFEALQKILDER